MKLEKQEILVGSSRLSKNEKNVFDRVKYFLENMEHNKSYKHKIKQDPDNKEKILQEMKYNYQKYRKNWIGIFNHYKKKDNFDEYLKNIHDPLSVDIETASVCDLACPHCSREYIITPDKIMKLDLYKKIIQEISKKNVPSIKLNWRGEPLLNPKIHELIDYAKKNGILEVSINTNAVSLDKKKSRQLIEAGLDVIIFSFDGGSKETYEKLRPARFKKNKFETVYNNIKTFYETKKEMNAKFPVTKIQMIMTEDSRNEVDNFFDLFNDIVEDVTVTQYNERGGNISDLTKTQKDKLKQYLNNNNLPDDTPYLIDFEGNLFISKKRKPCEQLFQRLMITYDGRVGMCCHDWGAQHGIGFIDEKAFDNSSVVKDLENKIMNKKKGFELLSNAVKPKSFNEPVNKVESLEQIWQGKELNKVRNQHYKGNVDSVKVCKECTFKDTYTWEKIN